MNDRKPPTLGGKATAIELVLKEDTQMVAGGVTTYEDQFDALYYSEANINGVALLPPYNPCRLKSITHENNTLLQCIDTMMVNVDSTGITASPRNRDDTVDTREEDIILSFFGDPSPGTSWITIRRRLRNDREATGNAYLEVLRAIDGTLAFVRHQEADYMRLCRLSEPRLVTKTLTRGGKEVSMKMWVRERSFVQILGSRKMFFREFGASRDIDAETGKWAAEGERLPPEKAGTEIIHFAGSPAINSPYGVPRWINNLPSALGSRKAELLNMEYFDSGGLPPALILVEGGSLASDVSEALKSYLAGSASQKQRAMVVEAFANSGSIDATGQVRIRVERFGANPNDAMFMKYDQSTRESIRQAYRLPPLFLGDAAGHNFATAKASILITEAQVFRPEREDFDATIDLTLCKALGCLKMTHLSNPINVKDIAEQVLALTLVKDKVEGESLVQVISTELGLDLKYREPDPVVPPVAPGQPQLDPGQQQPPGPDATTTKKNEWDVDALVEAVLSLQGLSDMPPTFSDSDLVQVVRSLGEEEVQEFRRKVAERTFGSYADGLRGIYSLTGCVADFLME